MSRFYFDILDAHGLQRDEVGRLCRDLDDAVALAQALLPDIVRAERPDGDWHDISCDVRDGDGHVVFQGELTYRGRRLYRSEVEPSGAPSTEACLSNPLQPSGVR